MTWCETAIEIVRGNREGVYGKPTQNFATIANLWNTFLNVRPDQHLKDGKFALTIVDVAHLMMLMKLARIANDPTHVDSHVDIAGYTDCAEQCIAELQRGS